MVFSDLFFLFVFLPACTVAYLLAALLDKRCLSRLGQPSFTARNVTLVIFSLIFYAWGEPVYVFLMLFCVVVNYVAGLLIDRAERHRRAVLVGGLVVDIAILATFKYTGFFAQQLAALGLHVTDPKIALPIGISFYIFQSISYLVDVYRREAPAQRSFLNLLLYISMFPQLIAGPIVRYETVAREISNRHVSLNDFAEGTFRFLLGLGKKVILANQLGEIADRFLTDGLGELTTAGAWIGIGAYMLQIYYDFSGYSDMAIGMGRCLGFHFKENFNHPYCCQTITDFWRRWHISLGSFFRDYVYIPLGGNRRHQALNILVVWALTGMWHGASWNFILWGLYFGVIVTVEKYTVLRWKEHIPGFVLHIYSLFLVLLGWGLFYFDDFGRLRTFFRAFWGGTATGWDIVAESALADNFWLWIASILFCLPLRQWVEAYGERRRSRLVRGSFYGVCRIALPLCLFVLSVALLVGATNNAFIYTRF